MIEVKFFIGSNNITHKPEYNKAMRILAKYYSGFNLNKNELGYWKGNKEKCFSVTLFSPTAKNISVVKSDLEKGLNQESVLITITKKKVLF
jgi:hypothetical protein